MTEKERNVNNNNNRANNSPSPSPSPSWSMVVHPLADFSSSYPSLFVFHLKHNFIHSQGKSTAKFHAIRKQVIQTLPTSPSPGPMTFAIRCLDALTLVGPPYNEGLGHLLTSALNNVIRQNKSTEEDSSLAKKIAASLICNAFTRSMNDMDERIMVKIIEVFDVQATDILKAFMNIETDDKTLCSEMFFESLVLDLIKKHSYSCASSLIKTFKLNQYVSPDFIASMVSDGNLRLAGKWAAHLGRDALCHLVQHFTNVGMFEEAYRYVKNYQLADRFPDARHPYKSSCLPKVLVKGHSDQSCDVEIYIQEDKENKFQQKEVIGDSVESCNPEIRNYLKLIDIMPLKNVIWIETKKDVDFAMRLLNGASVVGIDCEWKTKRIKDTHTDKVTILQIATREHVFVFDLITLSLVNTCGLNACIESVFSSPTILKIGYAVYNDLKQMFNSYTEMSCFHGCEPVLDLQHVSPDGIKGGLSRLTQMVLGRSIDKQMRMSDWEKRPLSIHQLHYAALDAAVLLSIFDHLDFSKIDWKQHVNCFKAKETCSSSSKPEHNINKY